MAEKRKKTLRTSSSRPAARSTRLAAGKPVAARSAIRATAKKTAAAAPAKRPAAKKAAKKTAQAQGGTARVAKTASNTASSKNVPSKNVLRVVEHALDELKAVNVRILDVRKLTDVADTLVIASGNSDRHVRSIADRVVQDSKKAGFRPVGVEGERDGEWVLVDLQDVIVHIMLPRIREFYRLENLWDVSAARREAAERAAEG